MFSKRKFKDTGYLTSKNESDLTPNSFFIVSLDKRTTNLDFNGAKCLSTNISNYLAQTIKQ